MPAAPFLGFAKRALIAAIQFHLLLPHLGQLRFQPLDLVAQGDLDRCGTASRANPDLLAINRHNLLKRRHPRR
jgi:hypothetical protein